MKLWIDDLRSPPEDNWVWAKNSVEALARLAQSVMPEFHITEISFDHDLGGADVSITVANELERMVYMGFIPMPVWFIHSANPVGRQNLARTLQSAERYANVWKEGDPSPYDTDRASTRLSQDGDRDNDAEADYRNRSLGFVQAHPLL